jgi:hypothetical protein
MVTIPSGMDGIRYVEVAWGDRTTSRLAPVRGRAFVVARKAYSRVGRYTARVNLIRKSGGAINMPPMPIAVMPASGEGCGGAWYAQPVGRALSPGCFVTLWQHLQLRIKTCLSGVPHTLCDTCAVMRACSWRRHTAYTLSCGIAHAVTHCLLSHCCTSSGAGCAFAVAMVGDVPGSLQFTLPGSSPPYTAVGGTCAVGYAPTQPTAACLRFTVRTGYARRTYQALTVTQVQVSARGGRVVVQMAGTAAPVQGTRGGVAAYTVWVAMDGAKFKRDGYRASTGVVASTSAGGWVSILLEGVTGKRQVR